MSGSRWTTWAATGGLVCSILLMTGCREERYFGPYLLEVPTDLQERTAGRTFRLPLDAAGEQERDSLNWCLDNEPDRVVPCRCDYPVMTVGEQDLRMDYRLVHEGGEAVNATVWVGLEVNAGTEEPDLLPDRPRIEPMATHLHRLQPNDRVEDIFSEDEMHQADLVYTTSRHPACEGEIGDLPAPTAWLVGAAIGEGADARISLELTFRIRRGD